MPLDPVIRALFEQMPQFGNSVVWEKSPQEARADYRKLCQFAGPQSVAIGKTEDIEIPGPGGPLPLRIYTPVAAGGESLPALVYYHGGGFVIGDLECYDALCRTLANESGCRVVAVDYRLAPEHPFPAAVEDCLAALQWVECHATELAVDPNRIAVGGDLAGGNLAAVTFFGQGEQGQAAWAAFQLLIYPDIMVTRRAHALPFGRGYFLDARAVDWFHDHYLPQGTDLNDPRLSLIEADLAGLPPSYVVTAGFDPLHDEGTAYAERLKASGVHVDHVDYPTMIHGFFSMQGLIPLSGAAVAAAARAMKKALE